MFEMGSQANLLIISKQPLDYGENVVRTNLVVDTMNNCSLP